MPTQVSNYIDVDAQATKLGCNAPSGITLLPVNFETAKSREELLYAGTVPTIRKLLRQNGIEETRIEKPQDKFPYTEHNAFEWAGPLVFVGNSIIASSPYLIDLCIGVISNYVTDFFKGIPGKKKVKLDVVVEKSKQKEFKLIHYEDGPEGLSELPRIVREVSRA